MTLERLEQLQTYWLGVETSSDAMRRTIDDTIVALSELINRERLAAQRHAVWLRNPDFPYAD